MGFQNPQIKLGHIRKNTTPPHLGQSPRFYHLFCDASPYPSRTKIVLGGTKHCTSLVCLTYSLQWQFIIRLCLYFTATPKVYQNYKIYHKTIFSGQVERARIGNKHNQQQSYVTNKLIVTYDTTKFFQFSSFSTVLVKIKQVINDTPSLVLTKGPLTVT